jgi:hypothetical protein
MEKRLADRAVSGADVEGNAAKTSKRSHLAGRISGLVGNDSSRSRGRCVLAAVDGVIDFLAMDRDLLWRHNAEANFITAD